MAEKLGEALLDLDTNDKRFRQGIDRAEKDARGLGRTFDWLKSKAVELGRGLALGAAAGVVAFGAAVAKSAREVAELAAQAKTAGVNATEFQKLKYAAEQNLVGVDALTDGLKELNLRTDEFIVTGQGSAADAFKRLGYSAEELKQKLGSPSALLVEIIGRLEKLDTAAQIRVMDEIFGGTAGEQFARFVAAGADSLDRSIGSAEQLGQVIGEDVVAKATELDQAIKTASTSIGNQLQSAIVNAGWALYDFVQQFWAFQDRTSGSLKSRLGELQTERARLEAEVAGKRTDALDNLGLSPAISSGTADYVTRTGLEEARTALAGIITQEREINAILAEREPKAPTTRTETVVGDKAADTARASQLSKVRELLQSLRDERDLMREMDPVQQRMISLRTQLAGASADQRLEAENLIRTIYEETVAWESAQAAGQFFGDTLLDSIEGLRTGSKSLVDVLDDVINALAQAVLQSMLLGQGPLSGMFGTQGAGGGIGGLVGSLFSGMFAKGGLIPNGTFGIVGENGPEPVIGTPRGAQVLPNSSLADMMGGGGRGDVHVTINGSGLTQSELSQAVSDAIDRYDRFKLPGRVAAIQADPRARG